MDTRNHARAVLALACAGALAALPAAARATPTTPDLPAATTYLVSATTANGVSDGTTLRADGYYESSQDFADFGLTIDGAYALAATHSRSGVLENVVRFIAHGEDGSGRTVHDWTGTSPADEVDGGYPYVESGAVGKEALLAEIVGRDPRAFGAQDLIAMLDAEECTSTDTSSYPMCAGPGNYENSTSTFDQALGILAQRRAGDAAGAHAPTAFLVSQQKRDGAWSSTIPSGGDSDVDSTAMAVMALKLATGSAAQTAAERGIAWIASRQESDGGFPGAAGDSTNSTGLALMALRLSGSRSYSGKLSRGLAFLAGEQNPDGGFDIAAGQDGSDVRASTQVVSGVVGTSFGAVSDPISR